MQFHCFLGAVGPRSKMKFFACLDTVHKSPLKSAKFSKNHQILILKSTHFLLPVLGVFLPKMSWSVFRNFFG